MSSTEAAETVDVDLTDEFESANFKCGKKQVKIYTHEDFLVVGSEEPYRFRDILCCESPKVKHSQTHSLDFQYIKQRKPGEKKLSKKCFTVTGASEDCQQLQKAIQDRLAKVESRPKKLYIIISPVSGGGKGVKIFQDKVEPLFRLAGIELNVVVTDRGGRQAIELLKAEDLTKYDGIVVCGGDGMYYELVNGVLPNIQKENGIDIENPECDLVKFPIPLGVIPTGTGNRIANTFTGMDVVTATLAIIKGETKFSNVETIYNNNTFFTYSGFIVCHGYFSDIMYGAEKEKIHGMATRMASLGRFMLKKPRRFQAVVEFLPMEKQSPYNRFELEVQEGEKPGWKRVEGEFMSVDNYIGVFHQKENNKWDSAYDTDKTSLVIQMPTTQWSNIKFIASFARMNFDLRPFPHIHIVHVKAFKVKLKYEYPETTDEDQFPSMEEAVDLDGEILKLKTPDYQLKVHQNIVRLFAVK